MNKKFFMIAFVFILNHAVGADISINITISANVGMLL